MKKLDESKLLGWQTYYSEVNGYPASFHVNMSFFRHLRNKEVSDSSDVFRLIVPNTHGDFEQIPEDPLIKLMLNNIDNIYYVGSWYSNDVMEAYFYCKEDTATAISMLLIEQDPQNLYKVKNQFDPTWSIFFDFLIPSELEVKINSTEMQINQLREQDMLDKVSMVEHHFYFFDKKSMMQFLHLLSLEEKSCNFILLQHSSSTITISNNEEAYLVKASQKVDLNNEQIYATVRYLHNLADEHQGQYLGWDHQPVDKSHYH